MASPLRHAIFTEGAALYQDLRRWRLRWKEGLQQLEPGARQRAVHTGFAGSRRLSSPLHVYYPLLFHSLYQEIPIETVRELALADRLYTEHLLSYDRLLDQPFPPRTDALFLAHVEEMQSLKRLYRLFPIGHPFWGFFYDCYDETWKSVRQERLFQSHRIGAYPLSRFCSLARGKTAVLKPFSLALPFLSNRKEEQDRLSTSLDRHHTALVLVDDLEDWKQDFQRSNFTFLLTRLIRKTGLEEEIRSGRCVSAERIGRLLYGTGHMESQLRLAEVFFQKAVQTVETLPLPLWKSFNDGFRHRCRALRYDLAEIRRREEQRVQRRGRHTRVGRQASDKPRPHPAPRQLQAGLTFLRASAMPCGAFPLSTSPHAYMHPSRPVAASRFVTTLIARSLDSIRGLGSGVHTMLQRASLWLDQGPEADPEPALPATLEHAFTSAPSNPEQILELDRSFDPGHDPLPDGLFWANFLHTCARKGVTPPRAAAFARDCVLRGFYKPWLHGVSFGPVPFPWTRHACRPLLPLLLLCPALTRGDPRKALQRYLLTHHRPTRSWENTTETALTLLCLLATDYDGPEVTQAIEKLTRSQEQDGSWAPNAVYREGNAFYGSRELTTAWCLEVLYRYPLRGSKRERAGRERSGSALNDTEAGHD